MHWLAYLNEDNRSALVPAAWVVPGTTTKELSMQFIGRHQRRVRSGNNGCPGCAQYQVVDALDVLLSGAVIGGGFTLASLLRRGSVGNSVRLFFLALPGAVAAWVLGQMLYRLATV